MNKRFAHFFITLGPIGYIFPSGTIATALTVVTLVPILSPYIIIYTNILFIMIMVAWRAIVVAYDESVIALDPSEIVIDEVIGTLVTFLGISCTWHNLLYGFCLFRLLDITKIGPIRSCEKVTNGWGILLDDIVAGLIANFIVRIVAI